MRILLADANLVSRTGIRRTLEADGFEICAEATDVEEAVELAAKEQPDLCLIDVEIPGSGIRAAGEIASRVPGTRVVMLTGSTNETDLFESIRSGASGYLLKSTDPARLPHALRGVLSGEAAIPRSLVARLLDEFRAGGRRIDLPDGRRVELTSREWEVLELLGNGSSTKAIAERMSVSPVTVRRHVSSILAKLEVPDRDSALRLLRESAAD